MLRRGLDKMEVARSMNTMHSSRKQSYMRQLDKVVSEQCSTPLPSTRLTQAPALDFGNNNDLLGSGRANIQVPAAENFHVQLSEACQKRFIIFDQSKHINTVILHPDLVSDFSTFAPSNVKDVVDFFLQCRGNGDRAFRKFFESPFVTGGIARRVEKHDGISFTSAAFSESKVAGLHAENLDEDLLHVSHNGGVHTGIYSKEDIDSDFDEDPKDIDVLLSLEDDLLSEGYSSASEVSSNCSPAPKEDPKGHGYGILNQKRKFDECDSEAKAGGDSNFGVKVEDQSGARELFDVRTSTLKMEVGTCCGYASAEMGVKQGSDEVSNNDLGSSSQIKGSRKTKLKAGVQHLKSVIPGVDHLDSEGVLHKTVQYVKFLQDKLLKLEDQRDTCV